MEQRQIWRILFCDAKLGDQSSRGGKYLICVSIHALLFVTSDVLDFVAVEGLVTKEATRVNHQPLEILSIIHWTLL